MISEILRTARLKEIKRENKIKSLRPGPKHNEADEVNQMIENNSDLFFEVYGDEELDRVQEDPEAWEAFKKEQAEGEVTNR